MTDMIFADLVEETTMTTGTGPIAPAGAAAGRRRFGDVLQPGDRCYYSLSGLPTAPGLYETGIGTWQANGTIARAPVLSSSGGAALDLPPGSKTVTLTAAAAFFSAQLAAIARIDARIDGEAAARGAGDAARQSDTARLDARIDAEISARGTADLARPTSAVLAANGGAALIGTSTGVTVEARIAAEESARASAVTAERARSSADAARPTSAVLAANGGAALIGTSTGVTVEARIAAEESARASAVTAEASARSSADAARPTSAVLAANGGAALIGSSSGLTVERGLGFVSLGQVVESASFTASAATHGGRHVLIVASGITVTLPASGFASGQAFALKNGTGGPISLTAVYGGDQPSQLGAGKSLLLFPDGGGFWRAYFHNGPDGKPTVSGAKGGNAALASLLSALAGLGAGDGRHIVIGAVVLGADPLSVGRTGVAAPPHDWSDEVPDGRVLHPGARRDVRVPPDGRTPG